MKTIQQIADELNVSRQCVYNRLKSEHVNIDTLTKEKRGKSVYFADDAVQIIVNACVKEASKERHVNATGKQIDEQEKRIKELSKALEDMTRDRDEWREAARTAQAALSDAQRIANQAQQLHAAALQQAAALPASKGGWRGWWNRLTHKEENAGKSDKNS